MGKARRNSREGDVLAGKYRLDALLGEGGMGQVYRAENTALGRQVAIKILREELGERSDVVMRFLREARAATIVRHPNVVDVLDVSQDTDGTPFIVQELLEGDDLASYAHARGGKLEVREAVSLLIPVVEAVSFAHARGVIHRDLKPENIFMARDTTGAIVPKLLDFGISRISTAEEQRMTATGIAVGTPAYMSPEQIRADKVIDARTDVWSFGVILHEVLSGSLPFQSEAQSGLFVKIVTEPPVPLASALPGAPANLAAVVDRCLRARMDERYASAADLARDLRAVLGGSIPEAARSDRSVASAPRGSMPSAPRLSGSPRTEAAPVDPSLVPDLALPVSKPRPAPAPARAPAAGRAPAAALALDTGPEIVPLSDIRVDIGAERQLQRPNNLRVASAARGMRTDVEHASATGGGVVGMGVMWGLVLLVTGLLASIAPGGWPVVSWATSLDGSPAWASGGLAAAAILGGIAAMVVGARAEPLSWGLIVASPGLILDGAVLLGFAVHDLPSLVGTGGLDVMVRMLFPWPTMLIALGVCLLALRRAWSAWSGGLPGRASGAAVGVVLAALALFGAVEIVRGVEPAPPSSTMAS